MTSTAYQERVSSLVAAVVGAVILRFIVGVATRTWYRLQTLGLAGE